jgi:hypothetical protein
MTNEQHRRLSEVGKGWGVARGGGAEGC